jgi:histidyl-tRNA synthetase
VLPLSRNEDLSPKARDLAAQLRRNWNIDFDDSQAIGKRYRRQDEIGTPFCITVDFDTLDDQAVTIRERDTMRRSGSPSTRSRAGWPNASSAADRERYAAQLTWAGRGAAHPRVGRDVDARPLLDRHALPGVRADAG